METRSHLNAFDNVKDQIGCCGIWCGSCIVGNGTLRELSRRYCQMLTDYGLEEWGPKDFSFADFAKGLDSMQQIPLCPGCQQGGGGENCEIRACVAKSQVKFCGQCITAADCRHAQLLEHMRSGAIRAGLLVEATAADPSARLDRWIAEIKGRWPSCILFTRCE
jgi:hypothetical protein